MRKKDIEMINTVFRGMKKLRNPPCVTHDKQSEIENNRDLFLAELRSGKYKKGTTKSDEKGNPIFDSLEDQEGFCACAIMLHLFDPEAITSTKKSKGSNRYYR